MRNIDFKLWHWPPYASHLAFLLLGIASNQCQDLQEELLISIPNRSIVFNAQYARLQTHRDLKKNDRARIVNVQENPPCQVLNNAVTIFAEKPKLLLLVKASDFMALNAYLEHQQSVKKYLKLIPHNVTHTVMPPCKRRRGVSYDF